MIKKLDVFKDAKSIHQVMQAAYKVEAELLNIQEFYPLNRTVKDIAESKNRFFGYIQLDERQSDELTGICELEMVDKHTVLIAALVVKPTSFRKGIATQLLEHVIANEKDKTILVSTAEDNIPAVALYQKFGFEIYTKLTLEDGLKIVELTY